MLPQTPSVPPARRRKLDGVLAQTRHDPPRDLPDVVRQELGVDLGTRYGGAEIAHPFGKASGQLSCTVPQVEEDVRGGLAFVVLKTVIAETGAGQRSMAAWTVKDTKMRVERRTSAAGREGWTVTWTGRGWHGTLADYLTFYEQALEAAHGTQVPVVPSVKYHLPAEDEEFQLDEYEFTNTALLDVWHGAGGGPQMLLEKDFSPTLAGDRRSRERATILRWLERVPELVTSSGGGRVRVGVKVMNAMADDDFQVAMLETLARAQPAPAYLIVFNRLFDATKGVAFGGWDLSDRNLRVLDLARQQDLRLPPLSATGNICSGRMMMEYALRGCENGQIHTFFQLPRSEYTARGGSRSAAALHTLLLHPSQGLVAWLYHLHERGAIEPVDGCLRFRDAIGVGAGVTW